VFHFPLHNFLLPIFLSEIKQEIIISDPSSKSDVHDIPLNNSIWFLFFAFPINLAQKNTFFVSNNKYLVYVPFAWVRRNKWLSNRNSALSLISNVELAQLH